MRTSWGSATDRGNVRRTNEDALLAYPPVFLVADGMGGHSAGDLASRLAVEEFSQLAGRRVAEPDEIYACFERTAVRLRKETSEGCLAGTTVAGVATAAHDGSAYWLVFNIGDSRVYRLADGELEQISVDHSVVQDLLDRGEINKEQVEAHPDRHVITRAIETRLDPVPDYWMIPAGPVDRLLICTDGLTSELCDADIARLLAIGEDPQNVAETLVAEALAAGGRDNVSVVVVDVARAGVADLEVTKEAPGRERAGATGHDSGWDEQTDGATVPR